MITVHLQGHDPDPSTDMNTSTSQANRTPTLSDPARLWFLSSAIVFAFFPGIVRAEAFNLRQVAPGIHVHQGHQVGLASPERDDIANIGFIIGERCVAVIDTGGSPDTGRRLREALRGITKNPVCYVINTHVHYDHILGNAAFLADGAKFVGHGNLAAAVENNRAFFRESFAKELGAGAISEPITGPDVTVPDALVLDLGNRKIRLTAHRSAHTDSDLSVFDTKTKTLWISDLLFAERIPVIDGSIVGWIEEGEKLLSRDLSCVIPGHGPVPEDWPAAVRAQTAYFRKIRGEIRTIIGKGGFLEDAVRSVGRNEQDHWLLYEENHKRNVTRAFAELEWE
jgi:quinoprotein relay system zinc metallohydrolase 2